MPFERINGRSARPEKTCLRRICCNPSCLTVSGLLDVRLVSARQIGATGEPEGELRIVCLAEDVRNNRLLVTANGEDLFRLAEAGAIVRGFVASRDKDGFTPDAGHGDASAGPSDA